MRCNKGFTLIEILVYVGLLGVVAIFVTNSLIQLANTYRLALAEREALSNARLLLETINKNIAQAQEIYAPTSKFNQDLGQLSLLTVLGIDVNHSAVYLDFYIDNGRFYQKQEGQLETPLSASSVRVTKFFVERILQGIGREAIKITLVLKSTRPGPNTSITLNSTTAIRGNY